MRLLICNLIIVLMAGQFCSELRAEKSLIFDLLSAQLGRFTFFGLDTADLFAKEINDSSKGALALGCVSKLDGQFPAGFLNASPAGQSWYGTMLNFGHKLYDYKRLSSYYFYERMYSPEAKGPMQLTTSCGSLKVARLIAGVDDTSLNKVQTIPRLPPSWSGYLLENWPICTRHGIVRMDISFERKYGALNFVLQVESGGTISKLAVYLPGKNKTVWKYQNSVSGFRFLSSPHVASAFGQPHHGKLVFL